MCKCRYVTVKSSRPQAKMRRRHLAVVREEAGRKPRRSDLAVYSMVAATAVISYANSLHGDFVHDDLPAVVTNADVVGTGPLGQLFLNDFWGAPMSDFNSHKSYRPLTTLSFRLNHALWGLRPWWWHACNVLLHAACCALVARACRTVARLQRPFAALAALLFAVHPVHTEAVAGVVGRADVLACVFFLSSLLVYHRPTGSKKYVWLSITLGALSMLAKETGITILFFNVIFDFYRCWPSIKRSLYSSRVEKRSSGLTGRIVKVLISLGLLIFLRLALLQGSLPTFSPQDNPAAFHPSFVVRLMTFCYLAAFNWWLLLCPWPLSHDWQLGSVPLLTSVWDPRNLLTCAAFGALLLICYRCCSDIEIQRHTPLVVGTLLLVLPYIPASNLFVTVGFVIAERVLYLPSVGGVIITAYGVQLMWYWRPGAKVFILVGLLVLTVSGVARTHRRNADWRDRATLLRADLATLPQNAKLHYNFANFLRESEQQEGAIQHYKEALRLWPTYASAHNNLGTLVAEDEDAEYHFLQAIKFNRYHLNAHYNLGKLYKKSGKTTEAMNMFDECVWLEPRFVQAYVELLTMKPEGERRGLLKKLIELEPNNWEHYVLYGNWLRSKSLPAAASKFYVQAVQLSFQHRNLINKSLRGDLIVIRSTALVLRDLGQKSRILQLLIRWHTWVRGGPSAAAHVYLREWRLRVEVAGRARAYSRATAHPTRTRRCFDHLQLTVATKRPEEEEEEKRASQEEKHKSNEQNRVVIDDAKQLHNGHVEKSDCCLSNCGTKKRTVSVSTQIKMTHNKSEIGLKNKKCALHRKQQNSSIKNSDVIIAPPLVEHIFIKTF